MNNKKLITILILAVLLVYAAARIFLLKKDPFVSLYHQGTEKYFKSTEKTANYFLTWYGNEKVASWDAVDLSTNLDYRYFSENWQKELLFGKWIILIFILIGLTPAPLFTKTLSLIIISVLHYISVSGGLIIFTIFGPGLIELGEETWFPPKVLGVFFWIIFLSFWMIRFKAGIQSRLDQWKTRISIDHILIHKILIVLYSYLALNFFLVPLLDLHFYSSTITNLTGLLLKWIEKDVIVDGIFLIGKNETLAIYKSCLGIGTIFHFAALVYITGKHWKRTLLFIILGFFALNFVNLFRLIILFNYVQINGDSGLVEFHDLYMYIVYGFVFLLWIIWFEMNFRHIRKFSIKHRI